MKKSILIFLINLIIVLGVQAQWKKIDAPKGFEKMTMIKMIHYKGNYFVIANLGLFRLDPTFKNFELIDSSKQFQYLNDLQDMDSNLLISNFSGYLFGSKDSGKTFQERLKVSRFLKLIPYYSRLYAYNPVIIFYTNENGTLRNEDPEMNSFTSKNLPVNMVKFDNKLFAFLDKSIIVKRGLNEKWKSIGKSNIYVREGAASDKKLFCNDFDSFYQSNDSGKVWSVIKTNFKVSTLFADSTIVLAGGKNGQIIYSNNVFQSTNEFKDSLKGFTVNSFYRHQNILFVLGGFGNLYYRNIDTLVVNIKKENAINQSELSLYPNPSDGRIFMNGINENLCIQIYSLEGKLLFKDEVSVSKNYLDMNNLVNGCYLVEISNLKNQIIKYEKIIIYK